MAAETENRLFQHFQGRYGSTVKADDRLLVERCLTDAEAAVLSYTHRAEALPGMDAAIVEYALVLFGKTGAEGESSRSEGGVSRTFEVGIPQNIKEALTRFVKVGTI